VELIIWTEHLYSAFCMDHVAEASWIEPDEMYSALGYPCLESSVPNLSVAVCVSRILSRKFS